jgi:hypothetical protein
MTDHMDRDTDANLDAYYRQLQEHPEPAPLGMKTRILAAASPRALTWQQPLSQNWHPLLQVSWQAALTCLLPLAIGFGVGMSDPFSTETDYEIDTLLFADSLSVINQDESYE